MNLIVVDWNRSKYSLDSGLRFEYLFLIQS